MDPASTLATLRDAWTAELSDHLLPFWCEQAVDRCHGGFVGRMSSDGEVVEDAPKAAVLNTRILWTFAAAARVLDVPPYRDRADRAFRYLLDHFWDTRHGGLFWMVDATGAPRHSRKHVYAQAFGLYALAEYYRATGDVESLDHAAQLFRMLETHAFDPEHGGYHEGFSRAWTPVDNVQLGDEDPIEKKSMNTHLHVLEAYANLYRTWPNERLAERLQALIELFLRDILDHQTFHLTLFFNEAWERRSSRISFGHDIEASWLLTEAADVLGHADLQAKVRETAVRMARTTLCDGVGTDHGLPFEAGPEGITDADRHWWPQAEAIVGFLNAYEISGDVDFLDAAAHSWRYIERHLVDRDHGEWHLRVSPEGTPYPSDDKVEPWKGPYHGVRACLEGRARTHRLQAAIDDSDASPVPASQSETRAS